jgi:hypothetical protein
MTIPQPPWNLPPWRSNAALHDDEVALWTRAPGGLELEISLRPHHSSAELRYDGEQVAHECDLDEWPAIWASLARQARAFATDLMSALGDIPDSPGAREERGQWHSEDYSELADAYRESMLKTTPDAPQEMERNE